MWREKREREGVRDEVGSRDASATLIIPDRESENWGCIPVTVTIILKRWPLNSMIVIRVR